VPATLKYNRLVYPIIRMRSMPLRMSLNSKEGQNMAAVTSPPRGRFVLGGSAWVVIVAVLLVLLAAAVLYVR